MDIKNIFREITSTKTIDEEIKEDIDKYIINPNQSIFHIVNKYYAKRKEKEIRYKLSTLKRKHNEIIQGIEELKDLILYW